MLKIETLFMKWSDSKLTFYSLFFIEGTKLFVILRNQGTISYDDLFPDFKLS